MQFNEKAKVAFPLSYRTERGAKHFSFTLLLLEKGYTIQDKMVVGKETSFSTDGVFLDVIGTNNLEIFASCYSQVTSVSLFYYSLCFSWTWDFYSNSSFSWGLCFVYFISLLTFESSNVL
jgi:hypothetical protein